MASSANVRGAMGGTGANASDLDHKGDSPQMADPKVRLSITPAKIGQKDIDFELPKKRMRFAAPNSFKWLTPPMGQLIITRAHSSNKIDVELSLLGGQHERYTIANSMRSQIFRICEKNSISKRMVAR